jgi:hypothetical protein
MVLSSIFGKKKKKDGAEEDVDDDEDDDGSINVGDRVEVWWEDEEEWFSGEFALAGTSLSQTHICYNFYNRCCQGSERRSS